MDTDLTLQSPPSCQIVRITTCSGLTRFYTERLEQAIEEGVEGVGFMLTHDHHFNEREYHSVTEFAEKGNRAAASKLLLDLVMEKGTGARRVMWESFVKLHHHLPKLSRILNEIRERVLDTPTTNILYISTLSGFFNIQLGRNELGDSGMKPVSAALNNLECKIEKLRLERVGLTDSGAEDLASALRTNPSLMELYLGDNKLGDTGVKLMSVGLRNPECKIQKLRLERVGLTESDAEDLASALSTNPSLTELQLSDNELGDSGVKLVSTALRNPECKIQKLVLDNVGLTDSGIEDLGSALSTNLSQTELDLGWNSLTDRSVPGLRRLILTLPSLVWIRPDLTFHGRAPVLNPKGFDRIGSRIASLIAERETGASRVIPPPVQQRRCFRRISAFDTPHVRWGITRGWRVSVRDAIDDIKKTLDFIFEEVNTLKSDVVQINGPCMDHEKVIQTLELRPSVIGEGGI
ncbi:uncharacterized protein [Hemitrygon akajei]|uniref:uncharacterized protein n=1 Tax=Hemitrygon akajei TaxID=2704970 RepID=UPI003BF9886C